MSKIYNTFLRNILLPIGDLITGQNMIKRYIFLKEAQWWDRDKINEYRKQKLQELVRIAYYEVPFYRELFDSVKVKPDEIKEPKDLHKLPIVTKDIIRPVFPLKIKRNTSRKVYIKSTSGSTGKNFYVLEDLETAGLIRAIFLLTAEWSGWQIGEKHLQTGMTLKRGILKKMKDIIFRCQYSSAYDLRDSTLDRYLEIIEKNKICYIWGYPGSIFYLSKRALELGWNKPIKSVITWGDTLVPMARKTIELAFKTKVFDTYGCGEGIQVAAQCGSNGNYHIHSLDVIVEIVDSKGDPVSDEEIGSILLTRLHPGPMPFIRYRVGDLGSLVYGNCSCGRSLELLKEIAGREVDEIITPSGNRLIVHFFTGIIEHYSEILEFQVVQNKKDSLILRIVPYNGIQKETLERLIKDLKEKGANDMHINIEIVKEITLNKAGKRKFVIKQIED